MEDKKRARFIGSLYGRSANFAGAIFDSNYLSPTLTTMQGGGREPHIVIIQKLSKGDSNDSKKSTGWETDK